MSDVTIQDIMTLAARIGTALVQAVVFGLLGGVTVFMGLACLNVKGWGPLWGGGCASILIAVITFGVRLYRNSR